MSEIKTANLFVKGNLAKKVLKEQKTNTETGEVVPEHLQLQFLMVTDKGMEFIKVKDLNSIHKDLKENTEVQIPIRVTASNMGQTYYEAV